MTANHVRMRGRDASEEHRAASPLDLLFDLTFVVAIAQLALQLSHTGDEITGPEKIGPYLMVFFAIWWAWISFAWFASAYDTDDALYRVFAVVQMAGVLVLAAGVPAAFADGDFRAIALGYLVMRIGLVAHWVRVAVEHPEGRVTALRYITGFVVAQLGWLGWLLLGAVPLVFLVVVAIELSVPVWAERRGRLSWHPGHIAERYGLFVILLLGESVLAAANGMRAALGDGGATVDLVVLSLAGLVLLVGLWWTYFLEPTEAGLTARRQAAFFWGWGHFPLFAALAAVGAWLEVAVLAVSHHDVANALQIAYALAAPVAIVLAMTWLVHVPFSGLGTVRAAVLLPAATAVLVIPLAVERVGLPAVVAAMAVVVAAATTIASITPGGSRAAPPVAVTS